MRVDLDDRRTSDAPSVVDGVGAGSAFSGPWRDTILYAGAAVVCLVALVASTHEIHRQAARWAIPAYVAGSLAAAALAVWAGRRDRPRRVVLGARSGLALLVLLGAGLAPQALLVQDRLADPTGHHAHSETALVEEGARTVIEGGNPYDTAFDGRGIQYWSPRIRSHLPFFPLMLGLGLPRALLGDDLAITDARVVFTLATLIVLAGALYVWRAPGERRLLVVQWLVVLPTGALVMAGGGHDLPVLSLLFLSFVLLDRRWWFASAVVLGLAVAMRQNAVVCVPFLALAAGLSARERLRFLAVAAVTAVSALAPFGIWNVRAFVEDTVLWPVDLGSEANNAEAPTLGSLVVGLLPGLDALVTLVLLAGVVAAVTAYTVRRPPTTVAAAARLAGVALLALVLAAPSGRVGYLLYPVNLLVWSVALAPGVAADVRARAVRARRRPAPRWVPAGGTPPGT